MYSQNNPVWPSSRQVDNRYIIQPTPFFFLQAPSYLVCMRMPLAGFVNGDGSENLAVRPLTKYRNLLTALRSASPWAGDPYYVTGWA